MNVSSHTVDGVTSERIFCFGNEQSSRADSSRECVRRIALAAGVMNDLDYVWRQRSLCTWSCFYSACIKWPFCFMAARHERSINTCGLRSRHSVCAESSQSSGTTSSGMLHVAATSGLDSIIDIARTSPNERLVLSCHLHQLRRLCFHPCLSVCLYVC